MPASTVRRNYKGAENVTRLIRSAEEYGDAYLIVDRLLVQHDWRRERLARNRAASSIEGEGPPRSHERIVKVDPSAGYAAAMSRNPGGRRQRALRGNAGRELQARQRAGIHTRLFCAGSVFSLRRSCR
jgi:hypothetical protein